jgi:hypothetical protein
VRTPVDHGTFLRALAGDWRILLTPCKPVPYSWFPPLDGTRVLGPSPAGDGRCPSSRRQGHATRCLTTPERRLPFDPVEKRTFADECAGDAGMQFSHTAGELLGGMARAGLVLDDAFDDTNGEGRLHELGIPTMLAVRAHRGSGEGRLRRREHGVSTIPLMRGSQVKGWGGLAARSKTLGETVTTQRASSRAFVHENGR